MSKHPTERLRSVAEMNATALQQGDKAMRRIALLEERLARTEGRLAEKDQALSRHEDTIGTLSNAVTALSAVVKELEAHPVKGTEDVLQNLAARLLKIEDHRENELEERLNGVGQVVTKLERRISEFDETLEHLLDTEGAWGRNYELLEKRITAIEKPPLRRRGRPKGSKNKPKDTPMVEQQSAEVGENTPIQQPAGESQ